jgi:hypothetical protein
VAGAETPLFSTFALHWVHWLTGGVPRLINILCDRALLAAYARNKIRVGVGIVRAAAREVETGVRPRPRWQFGAILLATSLVAGAGAFGVWQLKPELFARFIGTSPGNSAVRCKSRRPQPKPCQRPLLQSHRRLDRPTARVQPA